LPGEFGALLTRSIFARGRPAPPPGAGQGGPQGPEAGLGLRGVGLQDGVFMALIEDVAAKSVKRIKAGEPIASGTIKSIDLDSVVYEGGGGKTTKVAVGQNLLGAPLPPPAPPQSQPAGPPPGAQPGGGPQPGQPGQPGQRGSPAARSRAGGVGRSRGRR
jgi:hypothetical protein